ncbi:hypothetical protein [Gimesia algae]|uniref:Uncharacterized protein n=1 Tax=Gimesia algae TaxID=2527971 RepID=A0A517VML4_9PLAN|nr:hypothetical protein [Gimesia algae]QDT94261.1 hypothetical protein Pan161_59560 [Gimesia algae]
MANSVISWELAFEDSYEIKEGPARAYTEVYSCSLASVATDSTVIRSYSKCPDLGDKHKRDTAARCISVTVARVDDTADFIVTVKYSTNIQHKDREENPLNRPAVIDIVSSPEQVPTFFDGEGKPRLNTAGDLIVGYRRIPFLDITVKKNVPKYPDWMWDYDGTVNKHPITIRDKYFEKRTLRIEGIDAPDLVYENGYEFYALTFRIRFDPRTHDDIRYSQGFNEVVEVVSTYIPPGIDPGDVTISNSKVTTKIKRRITTGDPAEYITEEAFLDKNGTLIEIKQDRKGKFDTSRLHLLRFTDDVQTDFTDLPFK